MNLIRLNIAMDFIARKVRYAKEVGDLSVRFDRSEAEMILNDLRVFREQFTPPPCEEGFHDADSLNGTYRRCRKCGHEWSVPAMKDGSGNQATQEHADATSRSAAQK